MTIAIRRESWSPVYVPERKPGAIEITEAKLKEWVDADRAFNIAQREMAQAVEKAAEIARRLREKRQ